MVALIVQGCAAHNVCALLNAGLHSSALNVVLGKAGGHVSSVLDRDTNAYRTTSTMLTRSKTPYLAVNE